MPARKMVKLKVEETSGVDHPAHLAEGWIVMKSTKESQMASNKGRSIVKEDEEMAEDEEMLEKETMEDDEELEKADEEEDEVDFEAMFSKMRDERDSYKKRYEELSKKMDSDDEDDDDRFMKSAPPAVRHALEKARREADEARQALRKEVESRRDSEFVAKAASWNALSLDPEQVGPALRRLTDIDADLADHVAKALSSANAQADAANIFAELGSPNRPDTGDAYGRMQRMAKAAVDAGEHKTIEQALSALVVTHPELYDAYRVEQSR